MLAIPAICMDLERMLVSGTGRQPRGEPMSSSPQPSASAGVVRVAGGQGFYGDTVDAVRPQLDWGVDYLCLEGLAELTLAILQKDRARDETLGWNKDLPAYLAAALPAIQAGRTKLLTNAGGINPIGAGRAVTAAADCAGVHGVRVGTVVGDDLTGRLTDLHRDGVPLDNAETGAPWAEFPAEVLFASTYLGARPVVEALAEGAQVVVTGRLADPSLFVAPLVHEFGWALDDWDRLAAATVVGHLCECSGQSTGGNFSGEWWTIPRPWDFGYPVAECVPDGSAVLTKPPGTGGRVDFDTVRQQLLYEVHDTAGYVTPDVVADFTSVSLDDLGADRVALRGTRGRAATDTYKVLVCYPAGWSGESRVAFGWPDAYPKARATATVLRERVRAAGLATTGWHEEYWGVNALHGPVVPLTGTDDVPEVVLRVAWSCADQRTAGRISREIVPLGLSAPAWGLTSSGRNMIGRPSQLLGLWPTLVPKDLVDPGVRVHVAES